MLPAFILFIVFFVIVSFGNIILSFTDFNGTFRQKVNFIGLENYRLALFTTSGAAILSSISVTVIFSLSVTLIQNFIAVVMAVFCNMKLRLRNFYRMIIFMPSILGVVTIGLAWTLVLDPYTGPVNKLYNLLGIDSAILGDPKKALFYVIFVMIWANYGYAMVLYLSGLQSIPLDLYEAGRVEGTNAITEFRYITLPLLWPVITINVLISIIGTLKSFDLIMVLTNGGPADATTTLAMYIFKNLNAAGVTQGYVAALSVMLFIIVAIVVAVTLFYMNRREVEM